MAKITLQQEVGKAIEGNKYSLGKKTVVIDLSATDASPDSSMSVSDIRKRFAERKYKSAKIVPTEDEGLKVILEVDE